MNDSNIFMEKLQESFWGDLYGRTRQAWNGFFELESQRLRDRYAGWPQYERKAGDNSRRHGSFVAALTDS